MAVEGAFVALADPIRRHIVELLLAGERTAGEIAAQFPVSRPAVSRHLRVLRETGLVRVGGEGQRRLYTLDSGPLDGALVVRWRAPSGPRSRAAVRAEWSGDVAPLWCVVWPGVRPSCQAIRHG